MEYLYGWDWQPRLRQPVKELTEDEARTRFEDGPQLGVTAVAEPGAVPLYTLTMSGQAQDVRVARYDEHGSVVAQLDWTVVEGRLWLEEAAEWVYPDDGEFHDLGAALAFRSYYFEPDGTVELRSRLQDAEAETVEQFSDVDVSDHWTEPLTWGDWDRVGLHQPKAPPTS
jgi:hypothetical protein